MLGLITSVRFKARENRAAFWFHSNGSAPAERHRERELSFIRGRSELLGGYACNRKA